MTPSPSKTVLITGITGKQGGAVARHLLANGVLSRSGSSLRGLTRKPDSEAAKAFAAQGVEIVAGDFDNPSSVERALSGVWGVFAMANTWEAGVEKEEAQGKRLAELAKKAGVQHYVYTSVGSAHRSTGIPHFENKWRVEQTVRALAFPSHTILRPVFFMENLASPWFLNGDQLSAAMKPDTALQMIAVDDIGKFGAMAFERRDEMNRLEIDLAGEALTMPRAAQALSETQGRRITFVQLPIEEVRKNSVDMALMLEWFDRVGYDVDIPALEKRWGVRMTRFPEWARTLPRP